MHFCNNVLQKARVVFLRNTVSVLFQLAAGIMSARRVDFQGPAKANYAHFPR